MGGTDSAIGRKRRKKQLQTTTSSDDETVNYKKKKRKKKGYSADLLNRCVFRVDLNEEIDAKCLTV